MKYLISTILLSVLFSTSLFSQSNDKIYATINDIPHEITSGQIVTFNITIENKSRYGWSLDNLKYDISWPFTMSGASTTAPALTAGQRETLQYTILAPNETGKHKLTVTFYNENIFLARKTKNINIISGDVNVSDDTKKEKIKGKDKVKGKEKEKKKYIDDDKIEDKEKDKDFNKDEGSDLDKEKSKNKNK